MTAADLLRLVERHKLLGAEVPQFDTCTLKMDAKVYATPEAVRQELKAFGPVEGWLCFQSKITRFLQGEPLIYHGVVLYGEVKGKDGRSLHIQQDGKGGWILTNYEQENGDAHLAEDVRLIAEAHPGDPKHARYDLRYRIYWGGADYEQEEDDGQGWRQIAAAFSGFEKVENKANLE